MAVLTWSTARPACPARPDRARTRALLAGLSAACGLAGCGDTLVDRGYRGEPLFTVAGQITQFEDILSQGYAFKVSVFWSPTGDTRLSPDQLVEQPSVAVDVTFPATFHLAIFAPPDASMLVANQGFGVGLLLVYEDRDGNGRFTPGLSPSELVGGNPNEALLYVRDEVAAAGTPFDVRPRPGFQLAQLPLACGHGAGPDAVCPVRVGEPCASDAACLRSGADPALADTAACLQSYGGVTFSGGMCAVPIGAEARCLPPGTGALVADDPGTGYWTLDCEDDADCRANEGYHCDMAGGGCVPAGWVTDPAFVPAERARGLSLPDCDVPIGAPCVTQSDCGAVGECLVRAAFDTYYGGYCAVPAAVTTCQPAGGTLVDLGGEDADSAWMKACSDDTDCRSHYVCDDYQAVCLPEQPIEINLDPAFTFSSGLCVGGTDL